MQSCVERTMPIQPRCRPYVSVALVIALAVMEGMGWKERGGEEREGQEREGGEER